MILQNSHVSDTLKRAILGGGLHNQWGDIYMHFSRTDYSNYTTPAMPCTDCLFRSLPSVFVVFRRLLGNWTLNVQDWPMAFWLSVLEQVCLKILLKRHYVNWRFDWLINDCSCNLPESCISKHSQFLSLSRFAKRHDSYQIVKKPEHCLHYLFPAERDQSVIQRLRSADKLPHIYARTNRFKNSFFICFCVKNFQWQYFVWLCIGLLCVIV